MLVYVWGARDPETSAVPSIPDSNIRAPPIVLGETPGGTQMVRMSVS